MYLEMEDPAAKEADCVDTYSPFSCGTPADIKTLDLPDTSLTRYCYRLHKNGHQHKMICWNRQKKCIPYKQNIDIHQRALQNIKAKGVLYQNFWDQLFLPMCGRKPIYIQSLFCYGCWNTATIQEASPKAGPHIYLWRLHTEQKETFLSKITALFVSFLVSYAPSLIFHPAALYCYYMGGPKEQL